MQADGSIQWVPVGEVGEVRVGKQLSPSAREGTGQFPYLRVANVYEGRIDYSDVKTMDFSAAEREAYGLRPGDILLNEGQESLHMVGRSALYDGPVDAYCFQNTLIRFRSDSKVLPEYAQMVFVQWRLRGVFASVAEKTSISHLGGGRFRALLFPVRSIAEQRRIVEVVDAVEAQERAIKATIVKLRALRKGALFAAMAPVAGSKLPEAWVRIPLGDVVPKAEYGVSDALDQDPRGVPVLRMNNLDNGRPELSELRYSSAFVPAKLELRQGDVLFNRTNSIDHIGKSGMWCEEMPKATFASYLVRINPDRERLLPEYLVEWLMHPAVRQRVRSISTVAIQQVNVNPTRLRELEIHMPIRISEQRGIVEVLRAFDKQIETDHAELDKLAGLKSGLVGDLLMLSN